METQIKSELRGVKWLLIISGVLAILFGIAALFMPGLTLASLILLFAAFVVAVGIVEIISSLTSIKTDKYWWLSLIIGVLFLVLGIYLARNPGVSATAFVLLIGWALLLRGLFDVIIGFTSRQDTTLKVFRVIAGVLGVIAGIVVWVYPVTGSLAFTWVLGLYAVVSGCLLFAEAFTVNKVENKIEESEETTKNLKKRSDK